MSNYKTNYVMHDKSVVQYVPTGREYLIIAKNVISPELNRWYISTVDGNIIDPYAISPHELRKKDVYMQQVSEHIFDMYIKYINGQTRVPLKSIERLMNHG